MLWILHFAIIAVYLVLPIAAVAWAVRRHLKRRPGAVSAVIVTFICGGAAGISLVLIYATGTGGRVTIWQMLLAGYFATAMLMVLRAFDWTLQTTLRRVLRVGSDAGGRLARAGRIFVFALLRVCILFGVGLPYVMSSLMVYRPRVMPNDNPHSQLGFNYERVEFKSRDGTRLVGWWIPAQQSPRASSRKRDEIWGTRTVILCHGLAASKSNQLIMARFLPMAGFNVLAFDFRAHGESGGQLASFGDRERFDVLGAVRWLREQHGNEAKQILGVGASMGGAALISAAADDSAEGRAIDAVAVYAGYDRLDALAHDVGKNFFAPPLDWLLLNIGVPMASAHVGTSLRAYAPADDIRHIWPRPVMILHGERDDVIDFARGESLLDAASQPKYHIWFIEGGHNDIITDDAAARIVVEFFRRAEALPVI